MGIILINNKSRNADHVCYFAEAKLVISSYHSQGVHQINVMVLSSDDYLN